MFRWEEDIWLLGLWALIPVLLLGLLGLYQNARLRNRISTSAALDRLFPGRITWMPRLHLWLTVLTAALLLIAMANPQWGTRKGPVTVRSADAFILLDISQSMLVEDLAPDRMSRARKAALDLIDLLKGDRIGLVVFAGSAWLQMPLTTDYAAAAIFTQSADPSQAPTQGTALAEAIALAEQSFDPGSDRFRTLYVISDGEDHSEDMQAAIERLKSNGIPVYTIGIGTEDGSFIPVRINGRADYKRDETGNFIRSSFNPAFLRELSASTGGEFFAPHENPDWKAELQAKVDQLERREVEQRSFTDFDSYYGMFTGVALILLLLRITLPETRKNS